MNILEAYIEQYGFFNVIFSSVDYDLLKEIVLNLSKDFKAEFIDLFPIMINIEDIDNNRVEELTSTENKTRFIIVPILPYKYLKLSISFHINISLNYKLISERNIKKEYVELENKYKDPNMKGIKYINLSKYLNNTNNLENDIFSLLISIINKKLDNGNYLNRLKESYSNSNDNTTTDMKNSSDIISSDYLKTNSSDEITTDLKNESSSDIISSDYLKTNSSDDFTTDKLVSKKFNHDVKEKYLDEKNESIDRDIINDVSDDSIDPFKDINNSIELEDVNMDDKIIPTNDFSSMSPFKLYNYDQYGGINKKVIIGKRYVNKRLELFGKRKLNKKMK